MQENRHREEIFHMVSDVIEALIDIEVPGSLCGSVDDVVSYKTPNLELKLKFSHHPN